MLEIIKFAFFIIWLLNNYPIEYFFSNKLFNDKYKKYYLTKQRNHDITHLNI